MYILSIKPYLPLFLGSGLYIPTLAKMIRSIRTISALDIRPELVAARVSWVEFISQLCRALLQAGIAVAQLEPPL